MTLSKLYRFFSTFVLLSKFSNEGTDRIVKIKNSLMHTTNVPATWAPKKPVQSPLERGLAEQELAPGSCYLDLEKQGSAESVNSGCNLVFPLVFQPLF